MIVQIGDNGPVWYADMQQLRRVLKGVPAVVLVNVRLARSWQNEVNSELKSYVRKWPQAVIANWYAHSSQSMLSDGVHPQYSDRGVYAHVVYDALKQAEHNAAAAGAHREPLPGCRRSSGRRRACGGGSMARRSPSAPAPGPSRQPRGS